MNQFHFFSTWDDSLEIVKSLVTQDGIEINWEAGVFENPRATPHQVWNMELERQLRKIPRAYLTGPFTRFPLGFRPFTTGPNKGQYFIDPSHGGPVLGLSLDIPSTVGERNLLGPSMFWHQPRYLNTESDEWELPTQELKEAFKALVRVMKSRLKRYQLPDSVIFIGTEALEMYCSGKIVIRWKGKDYEL